MKNCLIIGRPGVGKTLFLISYAEHLGHQTINLIVERPDYSVASLTMAIREARERLVGAPGRHMTRAVQAAILNVPSGKAKLQIEFSDTPGVQEAISAQVEIRKAMAQTLRKIRSSDLILHVVDPHSLSTSPGASGGPDVDKEIAGYGRLRGRYIILVNKMDLPDAEPGFIRVRQAYPGALVLGISALTKKGFKELTTHVRNNL